MADNVENITEQTNAAGQQPTPQVASQAGPQTAPQTDPQVTPQAAPQAGPQTPDAQTTGNAKADKKAEKANKKAEKANKKAAKAEAEREEKMRDAVGLKRTAKEVKRHFLLTRIVALLIGVLVAIVAVAYVISYFYDKFGSFTVKVNKYDMAKQGLCLSETPEYEHTISTLNANIVYDMTNISGNDLPENLSKINGSHNGQNYIAYTFYLINSGDDTLSYEGELTIDNVTKNVDDAIRVAVYQNDEKVVYGKTKSNGKGMESDCDKEFLSSNVVMRTQKEGFESKDRDKYTVVIWLEGNDPDCIDDIIGGTIKFSMNFRIIEST